MAKYRSLALLLAILGARLYGIAWGAPAEGAGLLLVSIDGLNPHYVTKADQYRLKIPNLRRILASGAHASGMRGVLPTVTYPTHTTMLTGVPPAKHGIHSNVTFDPLRKNAGGWFWYGEDTRVQTLWQAAAAAGYKVGSVAWPVSVGAPGVQYLIPEYWRAMTTEDDLKLLRALSSPGLLSEFEPEHGKYIIDLDKAVPGDWMRTRYAASIIRKKRTQLLTLHLAALDHIEHETGPGSAAAFSALEEIDKMVGVLEEAMKSVAANAAICIVSDHGMARVEHELNLNAAFVKAGLMTLNGTAISEWTAQPWTAGGSAAIMLKNPGDQETVKKAGQLLQTLAADPSNGIASVFDKQEIATMGGSPDATFWVDLKPGFVMGSAFTGPVAKSVTVRGTHGYAPTHPEMRASFFIAGPGIKKGIDTGDIDILSLAPTLAQALGLSLPTAERPSLPVFTGGK